MELKDIVYMKRREFGLTQEQIASSLGVSAPAVNKWEKGITYPDITLLAPLARLLKTDINTLLCFQENLTKEEIAHILNKITDTAKKDEPEHMEHAFDMVRKYALEYPSHGELLYHLATLLRGLVLMFPCEKPLYDSYNRYALNLYERAAKCENGIYANRSVYALAQVKIQDGEYEEAEKLFARLPDYESLDKRFLFISMYMKQKKSKEASKLLEQKLNASIQEVFLMTDQLATAAVWEQDLKRAWELADYGRNLMKIYHWEYNTYIVALTVATEAQDADKCIKILDQMLASLSTPCNMSESILFAHNKKSTPANSLSDFSAKMKHIILEKMEQEEKFEFLTNLDAFQELKKRYKS